MFVLEALKGSARCSIDEGGLERGRGGTKELSVSSILDAQSGGQQCQQSAFTVFGLVHEIRVAGGYCEIIYSCGRCSD